MKDTLNVLKKAGPLDETRIAEIEISLETATLAAREAAKKSEAIENAVYDLKAVNPNRKPDADKRTPTECWT